MRGHDVTAADSEVLGTDAGGNLVRRRIRVRVVDGPDAGLDTWLDKTTLVVGSGANADLVLSDRRVSRLHVELSLSAEGVRVRDLGSRNGTFHGEARVGALVVPVGSRVRLGRTWLELAPEDERVDVAPSDQSAFGGLVGVSASMRRVFSVLAHVAPTGAPLVLFGEAGTGKSHAARELHVASGRGGPVRSVDLTTAPDRGALAQAFASVRGGTLLLEHVDRARPEVIGALRSVLEAREGAADARLVSTSRDDLRGLVESGGFDRDLFFHLGVVRVELPPLRERAEDVALLVACFGGDPTRLAGDLEHLRVQGFPGNVRQLRALVEAAPGSAPRAAEPPSYREAKQVVVDGFEREFVRTLLEQHDGNVSAAARTAGMSRSHLVELVQKHGLA